ncbi:MULTISPECIES: AI-2E family transporter [Aerococcus]|uniref:AI-2E family transporter n=1 Tax=Aerococcus tenax TaxID=3078812 RepID=A0A5N1BLK8_9LACT|nr:AI-2E family transporter [Aerococcus urinae]KAA9241128.1 AI-2E family transporter [Aerococcus urinae]MDK6597892.1 AI-2E family transporter [Aerococcus urinae]MDK7302662.1 AI-2E family transporter [Aerococcus urinae]MDK7801554.1 AI-2E family transporter [Aerococcus urinae]MDK8654906.1 AI-2E family transporter [Aerococcus urinae]
MHFNRKQWLSLGLGIIALCLIVLNWSTIISWLGQVWSIAYPITLGAMMAYVVNILMSLYEKYLWPHADKDWLRKIRRPLAIILALLTILAIIALTLGLIIPQLVAVVTNFMEILPRLFQSLDRLLERYEDLYPEIVSYMGNLDLNWQNMVRRTVSFAQGLTSSLIGSTIGAVTSVASWIVTIFIAIIITFYILMSKERLGQQFHRLTKAYLKDKRYNQIHYVLAMINDAFYNFIAGEVVEAAILGCMVGFGMWIFGFPYASMIGVLTGVTAIIPLLGAYISGGLGFLLILMHSPIQALLFVVFIVVVQQIEGNLIYPKVVGNSLGLPGMWVLIAVTVGGGLMGVAGMLIGVPIASAGYRLLKFDVNYREAKAQATDTQEVKAPSQLARQHDFSIQDLASEEGLN